MLNNNRHLMNVEDSFHLCPNFWGILKMFSCFRNFGQFENFFCPVSSSKLKLKKLFFVTAHHPECSSHMKINMLGRPTLPVLLLLSMGSSKDPHKVSHFLPPENIATNLGPLSSQNLDTSLPSKIHPNKQKYKSEKKTLYFYYKK